MTKYYLNKNASRALSFGGEDGTAPTLVVFDVFGVYGAGMWGVYSTGNPVIQSLLGGVAYVKEISESDYWVYLKKKQQRDANQNSLQYSSRSQNLFGNVAKNVQSAQVGDANSAVHVDVASSVVRSSEEFESASAPKVAGGEVSEGRQFASNKDELAAALGMRVWHARFKFYWKRQDAPRIGDRGHSVAEWRAFMEKVPFENGEAAAEAE